MEKNGDKSGRTGEKELVKESDLLLPIETLLSAGIHIGTRIKTKDMENFIFRVRPDGLFVLDIKKTDERVRLTAKFIARYEPSRVAVVSARLYGQTPVKKFCELTRAIPVTGRFLPGLFSNPVHPNHLEPHLVVVTDPSADRQAIDEAARIGVPVIALVDTDNSFSNIDFVIPTNNKGRMALATIYWLLARQVLRERGELPPNGELSIPMEEFETKLAEEVPSEGEEA